MFKICYIVLPFFLFIIAANISASETGSAVKYKTKLLAVDTVENFDDGEVQLLSWEDQDLNSASWSLSNTTTFNSSPYSLKLFGNTWKLELIEPHQLNPGDVWQVAAFIQTVAEIQGFGITDSVNTLYYSFAGTEELNIEVWNTVYQGAFPNNTWNRYLLPVADDWTAKFGYSPEIKGIIFINDRDNSSSGISFYDEIIDVTSNLPVAPQVTIAYTYGEIYSNQDGLKSVDVQFTSEVLDPDSDTLTYYWNFGDDSTSIQANPLHTFLVEDDHDYTVFLNVTDETGKIGNASCRITVDPGPTSFPVTINFVGDIILARRIQDHIYSYGYQSLFIPTAPFLGNAAWITAANLESPLTTSTNAHPTKPILLKGSPDHAAALKYGGIDLVTLANNHIIDYGIEGLRQTQSVVRNNNIICFGAGADSYEALKPEFYSKSGINFTFLGSSDRTGQYNNYQPYLDAGFNKPGFANLTEFNIKQQINSVSEVADVIIMLMHSGAEYSTSPDNYEDAAEFYSPYNRYPAEGDRETRRYAIDNGADAVICHHPHIIHGFEVYKEKLIAHSLGNFIFDLDYTETYPSMILNAKVDQAGIYSYTVTPVYIDDYVPKRASGGLGLYLLDDLADKSKDMNTYLKIDRENVTAEIVLDTTTIQPKSIISEEVLHLKVKNGFAVSDPVPHNKAGSFSSLESIEPSASWQFRLGKELVWFGNYEDEGCSLVEINHPDEYFDTSNYQGSRSLCHRRTSGQLEINTDLEEKLLFYSDTSDYTLHSYIKSQNISSAGTEIQFFQTRTSTVPSGYAELHADTNSASGWTMYTADFTLPSNAKFVNLRLSSEAPLSGTSYSWFDNTGVIEWTDWLDYIPYNSMVGYPNDYYWIQIRNNDDVLAAILSYKETYLKDSNPTLEYEQNIVPDKFYLAQNYPNPFNPVTTIEFEIPFTSDVSLKIYNILGQEVKTLLSGIQKHGRNVTRWNGQDNSGNAVSSGIYFYRLEAAGNYLTKKLILLK